MNGALTDDHRRPPMPLEASLRLLRLASSKLVSQITTSVCLIGRNCNKPCRQFDALQCAANTCIFVNSKLLVRTKAVTGEALRRQ